MTNKIFWKSYISLVKQLVFVCTITVLTALPAYSAKLNIQSAKNTNTGITPSQKTTAIASLKRVKNHTDLSSTLYIERIIEKIADQPENLRHELIEDYMQLLNMTMDFRPSREVTEWATDLKKLANEIDDIDASIYAELVLAYIPSLQNEILTAHELITKLREQAIEAGAQRSWHLADNMLAFLGSDLGNHTEGLASMTERLKEAETSKYKMLTQASYNALAYIYTSLREYEEALKYYTQAIDYVQKNSLPYDRESIVYSIAILLRYAGELESSYNSFLILKDINAANDNRDGEYFVLYGLALTSLGLERHDEAIVNAQKAIKDFPEQEYFLLNLQMVVTEAFFAKGDLPSARENFRKVEAIITELDIQDARSLANRDFLNADILFAEGNYEASFKLLKSASDTKDQINSRNLQTSVRYLRSSLDVILEKQAAERALKDSEAAYLRLITIVGVAFLLAAIIAIFMQRRYAHTLEISSQKAEEANRAKSEFLANMSHELRTPLNAILGFSEMMQHRVFGDLGSKQYTEYIDHINDSGHHLLDIINDILDLSKVEAGKAVLHEEYACLHAIINDAISYLELGISEKEIKIGFVKDDKLPQVFIDKRLVKQICLNILSNAVKFTASQGNISVTLSMDKLRGLVMTVQDSGIGMTPDELKVALQPFGQAGDTFTRSHKGTGLGLPLVKSLIELHSGSVSIKSRKDVGTTIELIFPNERLSWENGS